MPTYRLNISIEINENNEEIAIAEAKHQLQSFSDEFCVFNYSTTKVSLTRDGDRGGLNILLPKLSGRCGEHYPGRRATISEVLEKK